MSISPTKVLVIGGTGAQGVPVLELAADGQYMVIVLTRDANSTAAIALGQSPNVKILEGNPLHEATLWESFKGIETTFINTNGFAIGEKAEMYWGIRLYEIAYASGVRHFVWATLDYASKLGGFDLAFHCGHADGKARVADYLRSQPTAAMAWTNFHSAAYLETLSEMLRPHPDPQDPSTLVFSVPLGDTAMPLIALDDLGKYARWIFDNVDRSSGMTLKIATEHIKWQDLVRDFTEVTGRKAVYKDVSLDAYFASGIFPNPEMKVGHSVGHDDDSLLTYRQNFTGFWNMWKSGLAERDYRILDEILPGRIRSVKQWMILTKYTGESGSVLKDYRDKKKALDD